jgi:signal transduction histidine kinase
MTKSILVVDDTPDNLRLLAGMLTDRHYRVRLAPNGSRALATVEKELPDLILLDIMMPGLDGYDVCRHLKADDRTKHIPIIFISALDEILDKITAFSVGGVDYITKPFQTEEVLARVYTHLSLQDMRQQLQTQNQELQQQNNELDAFSRIVAHDLKNPLSKIIGSLGILKEYGGLDLDEDLEEVMDICMDSAKDMNNIINELLLLATVRKGEIALGPVDMAEVVGQSQKRLSHRIGQYQANIVEPRAWPVAVGYAPWLEEVWTNYISNALKYGGQPPEVILGATPQGNSVIRFWVKDNGPGLSPEEQQLLFTEFTRLDTVRAQGHGLGLSIVQRIVHKLHGQVGVESVPGEGSQFYFDLPAVQ